MVTLRQGEKKHYNHEETPTALELCCGRSYTNKLPLEGMSNLQSTYAVAFKASRKYSPGVTTEVVQKAAAASRGSDRHATNVSARLDEKKLTSQSYPPPPLVLSHRPSTSGEFC